MAFAAVALASCSGDDFEVANSNQDYQLSADGTEVFVTVADEAEGNVTRAGYAVQTSPSFAQKIVFEQYDAFKMYCKNIWMPQVYKFKQEAVVGDVNGTIFEWADASSKYNYETALSDREYGVFPADMFEFDNENREHLVFKLPKENEYTTALAASTTQEGRTIYHALVPMFGYNVKNSLTFNYMTSLVRVHVLGLPAGIHTIKLESGDLGSGEYYKLNGTFEATLGEGDWDAAAVTSGTYAATDLPQFNTTTTTNADEKEVSVKFTTSASSDYYMYLPFPTGNYEDDKLTLSLDGTAIAADKIEYFTAATANEDGTHTFKGGCMIKVELENPELKTVSTLVELNSLLDQYADFGRDVTLDVTVEDEKNIEVLTGSSYVAEAKKLIILQLKNNITLNIKRTTTGTLKADEGNIVLGTGSEKLVIEDAGEAGTGVLTISLADASEISGVSTVNYVDAPVEINSKQAIVLKGLYKQTVNITAAASVQLGDAADTAVKDEFTGSVTIATDGAVALSGTFSGDVKVTKATTVTVDKDAAITGATNITATSAVTLGGAYTGAVTVDAGAAAITLPGDYTALVTATTTGDITLDGKTSKGITATAANFTVSDKVDETNAIADQSTVTATTAININGRVKARFNAKGAAKVTVSETGNVTSGVLVLYNTGSADIKGNASKLTLAADFDGTTTITGKANTNITINSTYDPTIVLNNEDNTFAEVVANQDATITLTAGNVTAINVADAATATITTAGASTIGAVTAAGEGTYTIAATWDAKTVAASALGTDGKSIYTAAQLAYLQNVTSATDVNLYANISVAEDVEANWTPAKLYESVSSDVTFNGNGKTITGLTVKKNTANVGFFSKFAGSAKVTVKDLTLAGLSISATNTESNLLNIGGLVGYAATTTDITGVAITGTSIGSAEAGKLVGVGGLIGSTSSTVTIDNTKVNWQNIYGWYKIGGLIGNIGNPSGDGNVTVKVSDEDFSDPVVTVNNIALSYNAPATSSNNGLIGMLVGVLSTEDTQFTAKTADGITASNIYQANILTSAKKAALGFNNNIQKFSGVSFYYVGQDGNYIGYSEKYGNEKAEIIGTKYAAPTPADGTGLNKYDFTENK